MIYETLSTTVAGCQTHDSLMRCAPGSPCAFPACRGPIPAIEPGYRWNRDENGYRATPTRVMRGRNDDGI